MRVSAIITLLLGAACVPEEGPLMAPGRDCIECHDGGAARGWTAAGTWARGARVSVTDANGKTVTMRGNKVGNFYTAEPLTPPLTVNVDGATMPADALQSSLWPAASLRYGGCNLCHRNRETMDLELMAPGRDCLRCHNGGAAARFTVAGTWSSNQTVTIRDRDGAGSPVTLQTNSAGNFYTDRQFVFPLRVSVGNAQMEPPVQYGGCNACHGNGDGEGGD